MLLWNYTQNHVIIQENHPKAIKKKILELMEISPFLYTPGRALKSSKVLNPNIASQTDPDALVSWLNTQKAKLNNIIYTV